MNFFRDLKDKGLNNFKANFHFAKRVTKGEKMTEVLGDMKQKGLIPDPMIGASSSEDETENEEYVDQSSDENSDEESKESLLHFHNQQK